MSTSYGSTPRGGNDHDRAADTERSASDYDPLTRRNREGVVAAEKEQYGGIKIGSAFFGWLTATGTGVLLTALLAGAGTAIGVATGTSVDSVTGQASSDRRTIGLVGGIVLLAILFVAYYCGGYVAGRMACFNGAKQGIAVWLWALVIALVVAAVGAAAGSQYNVLADLNSFPRLPLGEGDLTTAGIIALVGVAVVSLLGAILGGLAGMRFHRNVDKAGLGE